MDKGFGVDVKWDVSLLDGYRHQFLPAIWDKRRTGPTGQLSHGIFSRLRRGIRGEGFDVLWVHGYSTLNALQGMVAAKSLGIPVLLRAESRLSRAQNGAFKQIAKRLFFFGLKHLVDGVLPIGTLNAEYWRHHLGEDFPQSLMPYAVDNLYFQSRCQKAIAARDDLQRNLISIRQGR